MKKYMKPSIMVADVQAENLLVGSDVSIYGEDAQGPALSRNRRGRHAIEDDYMDDEDMEEEF